MKVLNYITPFEVVLNYVYIMQKIAYGGNDIISSSSETQIFSETKIYSSLPYWTSNNPLLCSIYTYNTCMLYVYIRHMSWTIIPTCWYCSERWCNSQNYSRIKSTVVSRYMHHWVHGLIFTHLKKCTRISMHEIRIF